ncbi:hypothetical protein [Chishuiella sp.]|uniref:hypothetical protein n=1 Tax=Chishuiella sp. TaxID=1969467 RepID=UPI0028B02A38|nr:hypothetical protein [Chishuiella sp.]
MPYTQYPEDNYTTQNVRLVYLIEPHIRYVYVDIPNGKEADIPFFGDKNLHVYGNYATINISTHLLPDCRTVNSKNSQKKSCDIVGFIYFINQQGEEEIVDTFTTKIGTTELNYNYYKNVNVFINPEWREKEGTHKDTTSPQEYFVKIIAKKGDEYTDSTKWYSMFSFDEMTKKVGEGIKELFNSISYDTKINFSYWNTFDESIGDWVQITSMQPSINVRYDTMQMIYEKLEIIKSNQINYIGDVPVFIKEYDPCGYSTITISEVPKEKPDKTDKEKKIDKEQTRQSLVIFDEDRAVIDKTENVFEIVAGDDPKKISIKLGKLKNKNVYCQGLLLAKGEKHDKKQNIFQLESKAFTGQKTVSGEYKKVEDKTHQEQLKESRIPIEKKNEIDYDVIKNEDNSKIAKVKDVLNWEEGRDYNYIGEDQLDISIKYKYIKALTISNKEYNPNFVGNLFEDAWLFNYIMLNYEKNKQQYYIPIGSCRYPNQIVKINVLPDIKWTLLFKFNFKKEDWQEFEEVHNYQVNSFRINIPEIEQTPTPRGIRTTSETASFPRYSITRETTVQPVEREGGTKRLLQLIKRVEVGFFAEWTDNTEKKQEKDIIEDFYKPILEFFNKIITITKITGAILEGESNEEDSERRKLLKDEIKKIKGIRDPKELASGVYDIIKKEPVEHKMIYPSIGLGLSWYYGDAYKKGAPNYNGRKALEYNLQIMANPIIGYNITIDFLEMLARRHPIAYIIVKVVKVGMYLAEGNIDITFKMNGTLNLEGNARYNTLSGFSSTHSAKKEKMANLTGEISADLSGEIKAKLNKYQIITEFNASGTFKLGVKAKIIPGVHLATDIDGMYCETDLDFEGFTFYLKAEGKAEFLFFGMKIWEWEDSYEPKPWTVGEAYIASEKKYIIQ